MPASFLICLAAGGAAFLFWYSWFVRSNRRKGLEILRWIERALAGQGHVAGIRWLAPSRFLVPLRLFSTGFRQASVLVELAPRELPLCWLVNRMRSQAEETLTFQADLDLAPAFSLEVRNQRWFARSRKRLRLESPNWQFDQAAPCLLTTRQQWHPQITGVMSSLLTARERDFLSIAFRRASPHFSATVPLESISPRSTAATQVFSVLRELAAGASASRL